MIAIPEVNLVSTNIIGYKPSPLRKIWIFIFPHTLESIIMIRYYKFHLKSRNEPL